LRLGLPQLARSRKPAAGCSAACASDRGRCVYAPCASRRSRASTSFCSRWHSGSGSACRSDAADPTHHRPHVGDPSQSVEWVFTLIVCGLLLVYFLGSLSFCKYVCPYSAVFAIADRLAPGRIRLTGGVRRAARSVRPHVPPACACTPRCNSGARVTNSGCMRCLECVNACPRAALAYRFGRSGLVQPPVRTRATTSRLPRRPCCSARRGDVRRI